MEPYMETGRNMTRYNFFTSLELVQQLEKKKTTIVGTMNKTTREIPPSLKVIQEFHLSKLFKTSDCSDLGHLSMQAKKILCILSSMHLSSSIATSEKRKPKSVLYYHHTKYGVDNAYQMAWLYSVKACTLRWPLDFFTVLYSRHGLHQCICFAHDAYKRKSDKERPYCIFKLAAEFRKQDMESKTPSESSARTG